MTLAALLCRLLGHPTPGFRYPRHADLVAGNLAWVDCPRCGEHVALARVV